ncbi:restriction endonuclease subunit S [Tissierella creatinini]|nr:restriction endonuclease subunit S [Tissierella creatinini]TJX63582.1 restriction endonuclease subunit S [Soehngenia saccharolytica]
MSENKKNVPKIRFPGFTGAWEQRKFSEVFTYLQNNSLSRADLNYEQGLVRNVHYGDVLIKFGEILDVEKEELPFITSDKFRISSTLLLQNGDVIIADAAEDETVGKCSEIKGIGSMSVVSGLHTIPCRPIKKFATGYLGYYMNSGAYHNQLLPLIQGAKISSISKSALQNTNIIYPVSDEEQLEIGTFFNQLDNLITLHQRKLDNVKKFKAGLLQKMFPKDGESFPEVRFPGFNGAWEQRKLSDVADVVDGDRGKNYPSSDDFSEQGHTLFLSATNVTKDGFSFDSNQYITEEKSNYLGNGKLELNDIVLTSRGSLGNIAWYNSDIKNFVPFARINSGMLILRSKEDFEPSYIAQYLKSPLGKRQIDLISFGSAQPQLTKKDVSNYNISIPEKDEQAKLGGFYTNLDNLIALYQRKIDHLQEQKKSLLQQMFV